MFKKMSVLTAAFWFGYSSIVFGKNLVPPQPQIPELIQVENQIHTFYHDAWVDLMVFITIVLTALGVVMPLLITWLQNNNFKMQNKEMKEKIEGYKKEIFEDAKKLMHEDVEKEMKAASGVFEKTLNENSAKIFEDLKKELHSTLDIETKKALDAAKVSLEEKMGDFVADKISEVQKAIDDSEGKLFHLQSINWSLQKIHDQALISIIIAMRSYCLAEDRSNYKKCMSMLDEKVKAVQGDFTNARIWEETSALLRTLKLPKIKSEFKESLPEIEKTGLPLK